jgi:beta-N-acetylhexosaminidase
VVLTGAVPKKAVPAKPAPAKPAAPAANDPVSVWMRTLTPAQRIAQLIIVPCYGEFPHVRSAEYRKFALWVQQVGVSGFVVLNRTPYGSVKNAEPYALTAFLNRMQRLARVPLLNGGDFERGASMRVSGTVKFPHNMAYGAARDPKASFFEGAETAREARALGIHWLFAPVADVNNNPDNPVISMRSYGEVPADVAAHVEAYIEGARSDPKAPVLVTVKHFPGHGDTNVDSHLGLGVVGGDRARLDAVELVPFRAAIRKNVDAVMTAHLAVPAWEPEEIPATVSHNVLTKLLREELGFRGLVVTDAMDMKGLSAKFPNGEASVRALEAGADVLLMPLDPAGAVRAVQAAIRQGRLTQQRVDASVRKILAAKVKLGLHQKRFVDVEALSGVLEAEEAEAEARGVAERAMTLVRNGQDVFPITNPKQTCLTVLIEGRYSRQGLRFLDEVALRAPDMPQQLLDPSLSPAALDEAMAKMPECASHVVVAFANVNRYSAGGPLAGQFPAMLEKLLDRHPRVGLISLGHPYLLRSFPKVPAFLTSYSATPTAEAAAVRAMFGEIKLTGKLPVTIPGLAPRGTGIELPARERR